MTCWINQPSNQPWNRRLTATGGPLSCPYHTMVSLSSIHFPDPNVHWQFQMSSNDGCIRAENWDFWTRRGTIKLSFIALASKARKRRFCSWLWLFLHYNEVAVEFIEPYTEVNKGWCWWRSCCQWWGTKIEFELGVFSDLLGKGTILMKQFHVVPAWYEPIRWWDAS